MSSIKQWAAMAAGSVALAVLSACGGGGNESGPPDELVASPAAVTVNATGGCAVGEGPTVHVYGGEPPYVLSNSVPGGMSLDKTKLLYSGDGFTITFINGVCLDQMPITVEDEMGRLLEVSVTNQPL